MAKAFVQFVAKNGALYGDPARIETHFLPRTGELVRSPAHSPPGSTNRVFVVQSVVYELTSEGFVPFITARQWYKGLRAELLAERGWLPEHEYTELVYDEDDPPSRNSGRDVV